MRAWIIKNKGKTWLGNMPFMNKAELDNGGGFYCDYIFYRKSHAKEFLKALEHSEHLEVVGVTIDKSEDDNRRRK